MTNDDFNIIRRNQSIMFDAIMKLNDAIEEVKFNDGISMASLSQKKYLKINKLS